MKKRNWDPNWKTLYADKIVTPQSAVASIKSGQRIFLGTGCATPVQLINALITRAHELADVEIIQLLTHGEAPNAYHELAKHFRVNSFFITANVRDIIQKGLGDYTPLFLSDIPRLFSSGQLPIDVAMIEVSPPDERGFCSLGVSVDICKSAAENARRIIAQVNEMIPRTRGNSFLHVYDLDFLVPIDLPVIEFRFSETRPEVSIIGDFVASLIDDCSTIEVGIGHIPQSILNFLKDKKNLGIHTNLITDTIIDLVKSGVINGSQKTIDRGKIVTSFCMGTTELYDLIDDNPMFSFQPIEYVNDPILIGRQHKMIAINLALEVDLTGQVCSDSLGTRLYSGPGGQTEFNWGAARSTHGKVIHVLPSTTQDGKVSRIVPHLSEGAEVVTTRGGAHYIVTEYGVAYLHGKSVHDRALALISIAHPNFRSELLRTAIEAKYVRSELAHVEGKILVGPQELKTAFLLSDGTQIYFRPIHPTDEPAIKRMFYTMSADSIYYRFMERLKSAPGKQLQDFVYIDHRNELMIVGTLPEADGERIIACGGYYLNPHTNRAEVAFIVEDKWHNRGIGTFLLKYLIQIARHDGIAGFTAEVLQENKSMQSVINKSGCTVKSLLDYGVYHFEIDFE
jgi:acyl-CoA hydrolase/GNAT superfamily N-acetyltransferase